MIEDSIRHFFVKHGIAPCRIVAAISGGTDSTALLLALADLRSDGFEVIAAHVNHHLRGAESDADADFVRRLCDTHRIELHVADGTLDAALVRDTGIEGAARTVRYARLREIRDAVDARFVATAHQRNDQAETVLIRLMTGSGLAGLRGIHPVRDDGFVRPLLDVSREELEAFLRERGITPRHDRSNDDPRFLRNRVRVWLRDAGTDGIDSIASIAAQAQELWPHVDRMIDAIEVVATADQTRFVAWPDDPWLQRALLHRHIHRLDPHARDVSAADLARLAETAGTIRRVSVTKNLELIAKDGALVLRRKPARTGAFEVAFTSEAFVADLGVRVRVGPPTNGRQQFQLPDGANASFVVRNRRTGDRFQPLGLARPKKLKDFLIDRKIPAELRDSLPLLLWHDEIVWVAGVEISERFKVTTPPAGTVLEVWLEGPLDDDSSDRDPADVHRR